MKMPAMPRWPAALVFEDGSIFRGVGFGRCCEAIAEIVFNTSMTGYQECVRAVVRRPNRGDDREPNWQCGL